MEKLLVVGGTTVKFDDLGRAKPRPIRVKEVFFFMDGQVCWKLGQVHPDGTEFRQYPCLMTELAQTSPAAVVAANGGNNGIVKLGEHSWAISEILLCDWQLRFDERDEETVYVSYAGRDLSIVRKEELLSFLEQYEYPAAEPEFPRLPAWMVRTPKNAQIPKNSQLLVVGALLDEDLPSRGELAEFDRLNRTFRFTLVPGVGVIQISGADYAGGSVAKHRDLSKKEREAIMNPARVEEICLGHGRPEILLLGDIPVALNWSGELYSMLPGAPWKASPAALRYAFFGTHGEKHRDELLLVKRFEAYMMLQ